MLVQDLTTQRTAALRAALSVRLDIALIAITHNLAAQTFYDQSYLVNEYPVTIWLLDDKKTKEVVLEHTKVA